MILLAYLQAEDIQTRLQRTVHHIAGSAQSETIAIVGQRSFGLRSLRANILKAEQWRFRTPGATHYELFFEDIDIDGQGIDALSKLYDFKSKTMISDMQSRKNVTVT